MSIDGSKPQTARAGGGISSTGDQVEQEYRDLTGASETERAALGDAVLDGNFVEIKKASSVTINQVRAVKYIPIVIYSTKEEAWFVVPAHEVVVQCATRKRGQHTENPFESATLNLNKLGDFRLDSAGELRQATLDAIDEAAEYPELRELMEKVLTDSKALAARSKEEVSEALEASGLA